MHVALVAALVIPAAGGIALVAADPGAALLAAGPRFDLGGVIAT